MAALGALLGAGALFGQAPAIAGKAAVGMTLIGAGIAGFLTGLLPVKLQISSVLMDLLCDIMINLAEGLNPLVTDAGKEPFLLDHYFDFRPWHYSHSKDQ